MQKMKSIGRRLRLTIAVFVCVFSMAHAQQRFSAGPRIGANFSTFAGDVSGYTFKPGLAAGAFVMYSSLNHFGISADVLYSQMGAKHTAAPAFQQRLTYLEVPVALRYFLTLSGNFRPNILVGPSLAFLLNAKNTSPTSFENTNSFRPMDLGLMAGFQLNWKAGDRQRFLVDARYRYGLSDITVDNNARVNNSTITLTLGYGFGIGREY